MVDGGPVHKCPVCSVQLRVLAIPLVCSRCNSEVHKKCSGLIEAGTWVCDGCSGNNNIAPPATAQIPASAVPENPLDFCKRNSLLVVHWNSVTIETKLTELSVFLREGVYCPEER